MSIPVGQVRTQAPQSMQSPAVAARSFTPRILGSPRLGSYPTIRDRRSSNTDCSRP